MPVFCFCDAEDGEKTSILGFEKGKNKELTHYKITVNGPLRPTHPSVQFDALKSEMLFLSDNGEVNMMNSFCMLFSAYTDCDCGMFCYSLLPVHLHHTKLTEELT